MKTTLTLILLLLVACLKANAQCVLEANAGPDLSVPCGSTITLNGTANVTEGVAFRWTPTPGFSNPNVANPSITLNQTSTFVLRVSKTGCTTDFDTVTITVLPQKGAILGLPDKICTNASPVTLTGIPSGGAFSGSGLSGNVFKPANLTPGSYVISYSITLGGCDFPATDTVEVVAAPTATFLDFPSQLCSNSQPVALTATPNGGVFSGVGIDGDFFIASTAGAGHFPITYSGQTADGCAFSVKDTINVIETPTAAFTNAPTDICADAAPILLTASPDGGIFNGPGISGAVFNPGTAGVGQQSIEYSGTSQDGCVFSTTQTINVISPTGASISGLQTLYCVNAPAVTLSGTPSGGTFSGPGVDAGAPTFTPATAGPGNHFVTYSGTSGVCNYITSIQVTVSDLPNAAITGVTSPICITAAAITPVGLPSGGTLSGPGVTSGQFTPATAGAGLHTLTYSGVEAGCAYEATLEVQVSDVPQVTFIGLNDSYCMSAGVAALLATPAGGTFSGTGVTGNVFDPTAAGAGTYVITYTGATDGCNYSATKSVTVGAGASLAIAGVSPFYLINDAAVTFTGFPAGGAFSGPGMTGTTFTPSAAGAGVHTLTYSGVFEGCAYSVQQAVTVRSNCSLNASITPTDVSVTGGSNGSISANYGGLPAGTYTVSIVGPNGCTYQEQVTINEKDCNGLMTEAGSDLTVCNGVQVELPGSATGGAGGYTYSWAPTTGLSDPTKPNPTATPAFTTAYTLTVTDVSGCKAIDVVTVSVIAGPALQALGTDATCFECANGKIEVVASGGTPPYAYSLNGGPETANPMFTNLVSGDYTVTVRDNNGCRKTVPIFISQPIPACTVPANLTVFNITSATATVAWATVAAATQYVVSYRVVNTSNFTEITTPLSSVSLTSLAPATNYEVRVKAICVADQTSAFTDLKPFTTLTVGAGCAVPGNIAVTPGVNAGTLNWTAVPGATRYNILYRKNQAGAVWTSAQAPGTATSFLITGLQPGVEYVVIMNTRCATSTSSWSSQIAFTPMAGRRANSQSSDEHARENEDRFSVYPNPLHDRCFVRLFTDFEGRGNVVVSDLDGRELMNKRVMIAEGQNEFEFDMESLPTGVYLLALRYGENARFTKLFIRK